MSDAADRMRYGASALATPANAITVARMALAIPFLAFVANGGASYWAVVAWAVLAGSDGIDGHLARKHGTTRSGAFLDPLADKILVLGAAWALVASGTFWWVPVLLITVREIGISVFRSWYARRGIAVPARYSAKVKTVVQEFAVAFALLPPVAESAEWVHVSVLWAAVVLTIGTGISYVTDGARSLSRTGDRA
ncbi:MAG TPA: CDP-alcohol phosphatidyltransferase family protein [Acidimicrobiales bacterium]